MYAIIERPPKTATSSGKSKIKSWKIRFVHDGSRSIDPLMGWSSSEDMMSTQVKLEFDSKEKAIAYAEKNGLQYEVVLPKEQPVRPKSYSDNFK